MALRRPRVKAYVNFSSKRKVKKEPDDGAGGDAPPETKIFKEEKETEQRNNKESIEKPPFSLENTVCQSKISPNKEGNATSMDTRVEIVSREQHPEEIISTPESATEINQQSPVKIAETHIESSVVPTENQFKCPLNVERRETTITKPFILESEENFDILHNSATNSPVKPRQRIRPMPYFGLRRNSVQGSGGDSEDESKRHKISSITAHSPLTIDSKINSSSSNRRRTESTCSNVSESNIPRENRPRKIFVTEESQRISAAKREFQSKFNGKAPEKSLLKMFDFIYYNPSSNPMKQVQKSANGEDKKEENGEDKKEENQNTVQMETDAKENEKNKEPPANLEKPEEVSNLPVPQLKLGPNGELILDETSLVIQTTAEKEARVKLANSSVIYVDENTGNNGFYRRKKRTRDWTAEETIKFYRCLHTVGTDFSLMLTLFPNRSRRDLKLKFKKEERHNLALINKALLYPKMFDIDELKEDLEKDEREAAEKQKKWEQILSKNPKPKEPTKINKNAKLSKADRCLSNADKVYKNENVVLRRSSRPKKKVVKSLPKEEERNEESDDIDEDYEINEQTVVDALFDSDDESEVPPSSSIKKVERNKADDIQEISNCSSSSNNPEMMEKFFANVNNVLKEIANGSLVVVSSEDPNNPEEIVHEIYVICKETGELSDEPLELPEDVMQCIISAIHA